MRIAFYGKGGSGKTTTAAGFIKYLASERPFVLAIDSDVNVHLGQALSITGDVQEVGREFDAVTAYLRGNRTDLGDRPMIMTTPPARQSNFVRVRPDDPLIRRYALRQGNIALLTVGHYEAADLGSSCYHSKQSSYIALLHHLLDGKDDFVVADTIAGTDSIATSLWFAYDVNIFVVEPTKKSVSVYKDYIRVVPQIAERTFVVANKIEDAQDEQFVRQEIEPEHFLGAIPLSRQLRRFEQGNVGALDAFHNEQKAVFDELWRVVSRRRQDWPLYLTRLRQTHSKLCRNWYDSYYGVQLDSDLDEEFSYANMLAGGK